MNVCEAARKRIQYAISEFDNIIVSFSGGKDSGVMLNLTLDIAKEMNCLHKIGVYHMDYEAQYQATTDYVTEMFNDLPKEVRKYWVCLPIKAQCSVSMFQSFWQPWKFKEKEIWCRELPENSINEENFPYDFDYEISDYQFNIKFGKEMAKTEKTCFLIGIRTQESLHRYKAVNKFNNKNEYKGKKYTTKITENLVNMYPIYDWLVDDIWVYNAKFQKKYNKIYDLFYQAGLKVNAMRVASPFNDAAQDSLKLYKVIDPNNWGKLIGRVNGVNFTGLYGGTTAMGWKTIKKPDHFTWKEYMYFLLDTLPKHTRDIYLKKLETSIKYWTVSGGALPKEIVKELTVEHENLGKPKNNRNYTTEYDVIRFKDYLDEIEISKPNLLPTYKRMCIAILKNDTSCKTLGFGQTKYELEKRKNIMEKYRNL
ncbi:phosphoadenosine phosphosulfate reductase family protein [Fusobacterium gonidiaformans 3-1-5R]|uniref:Phosphoadenosine phosphosulfate reductase family protein n=1 Tax=Fusobacterium gonidiaformans 3-1-5R TaxID=469605 RepID=E5BEM6_9FUSO|nr:DUF3440 domain-containing protein [Fusobacterium gonidiaformans]EFS20557.1 phosphoadenosine phosphosulfate reductase family protein [Fusobacterium gonidiaformans 3-1-5R]